MMSSLTEKFALFKQLHVFFHVKMGVFIKARLAIYSTYNRIVKMHP